MTEIKQGERYRLLDAIRAAAILNMVIFHLCYNIFCVFGVWQEFYLQPLVILWERLICGTFILVSGMVMNFSRHGYRRGVIVNLCGFAVTAVTVLFIPEQAIWFGVLNFLGCAMLITFALRTELSRMRPLVGMAVFFVLFMLCYGIPQGYIGIFSLPLIELPEALYQYRWLAFLGFPPEDFYSADYFPLLQWIFFYLFGFELWRFFRSKQLDRFFTSGARALDFIGKHSLIIYMAHQPILYALCYLMIK